MSETAGNEAGGAALVTGAAGGIGSAICELLAHRGMTVCGMDTAPDRLALMEQRWPGRFFAYPGDVSNETQVCEIVEAISRRCGAIQLLVNNAAILRDGALVSLGKGGLHKMPTEQWEEVIRVNLTGAFLLARETVASMIRTKTHGLVVNISSISRHGNAGQSSYAASKAALDALVTTWAREWAFFRIRAVGIAPGLIDTPMVDVIPQESIRDYLRRTPAGRVGKPEEIAQTVGFILDNIFINGRILEVDGGLRF